MTFKVRVAKRRGLYSAQQWVQAPDNDDDDDDEQANHILSIPLGKTCDNPCL